jgi:hypothetical protein
MIEQPGGLARTHVRDTAQPASDFTTYEHGQQGNGCQYQKGMVADEFGDLAVAPVPMPGKYKFK